MPKKSTTKKPASPTPHVGVRMDPVLREAVIKWSLDHDTTISRAVETLVRAGFMREKAINDILVDVFNGRDSLYLAIAVTATIRHVEQAAGNHWGSDQATADAALAATTALLRDLMHTSANVNLAAASRKPKSHDLLEAMRDEPAHFGYRYMILRVSQWLKNRTIFPWRTKPDIDDEDSPVGINEIQAAEWIGHRLRHVVDIDEVESDDIAARYAAQEELPVVQRAHHSQRQKVDGAAYSAASDGVDLTKLSDEEFAELVINYSPIKGVTK